MNNLFKVILLCAILSNTFTPCFSFEAKPFTQDTFTSLTLTSTVSDKLAEVPIADPVQIANNDDEGVSEELETEAPLFISNESELNLSEAQSDITSMEKNEDTIVLVDGEKIAEDLLCQVQERCKRIGVTVDFECDVPHTIAEKCDIFEYGARKLQRAVQKSVEDELAYMIVNGQGDHYVLTSENGEISVRTASDVYHETKS